MRKQTARTSTARAFRSALATVIAVASLAVACLATTLFTTSTPVSAASGWDVKTTPPALPQATRIDISAGSPTSDMPAWGILCSGKYHRISLDPDENAVISFSGSEPLRYPVWVVGGNNVRIIGLEMSLVTQDGCGVGELPNRGSNATNIHPRIPSAMAVRLENYGTSFVEGADIDLRGHEADCFVVRNPGSLTNAQARNQRHVVIQNTSCRGIEGLGVSEIGDGVHGDLLQNQGNDVISSLTLENVSVRSSMEGLVLHEWDGYPGARDLKIRRLDYAADSRYANDDGYEQWGVAFAAWADNWSLEQVHIQAPGGNDYGFINDQRYGGFSSSVVQQHRGITRTLPAGGSFAPADRVGAQYHSPHGGHSAGSGGYSAGSNEKIKIGKSEIDQIIRLYQAAFGRSPDDAGLSFWISRLEQGDGLGSIAGHFRHSAEWQQRFGSATSEKELVYALYANVLNRTPDDAGLDYWIRRLELDDVSAVRLVLFFSESPENVVRTGTSAP